MVSQLVIATQEKRARWLLLAVLLAFHGPPAGGAEVAESAISDLLRRMLESAPVPLDLEIGGERALASVALPAFYEQRAYRPAWISGSGPASYARDLLEFLQTSVREGLNSDEYHSARLRSLLAEASDRPATTAANTLTELDLLLTDAFLMAAAHLVSGRVDPTTLDREWIATRREVDLVHLLSSAVARNEVAESLESLLPDHPGYRDLRALGERYRQWADNGGWPRVADGSLLRKGDRDPRVAQLRRRLRETDGLVPVATDSDPELFDEETDEALRRFQGRHGLDPDGVLGPRTLAALNVSVEDRLQQIYLNLERWRWLPQSLGDRYVLVNLPAFDLRAVENDRIVLQMRVAVGRRYRRTPVFSDTIRYLVFNPYWEIPPSIAINDKLPEIRKDVDYLRRQGIRVLTGWATDQREIDPSTVSWNSFGVGSFPYRLRQDPGPLNALGRVKFMFPNRFNVYLHDTPGQEVFRRADRDVSSGCIRLERPFELAELLLQKNRAFQPGMIQGFLRDYQERTVRLDTPWPVHLLHWTAWVDDDRTVHFRADLYGRDENLAKALESVSR